MWGQDALHIFPSFSVFSFPLQDHLSIYSYEVYKETLIDSKHISISEMFPWAMNSVFGTLFLKVYTEEPRWHIKKQRHYFANEGPSSQGYGFFSSHVRMWELGL